MIKETYQKLLGKDPTQADTNYFLNTGISEEDLVKRIFKSEDHKKLVEDAKDAVELRKKSTESESEQEKMKANVQDLQAINQNLSNLLQYKNHQIAQMQNVLRSHGIIQNGEYFDYNNPGRYAGNKPVQPQR
jgi:mevalonate kinase